MGWFSRSTHDGNRNDGGWFGMSRREQNHLAWEKKNAKQAIRAKGRLARDTAIAREQKKKKQKRKQRNNFREW